MNPSIKVTKKDIKPILEASFPDYSGKKFSIEFTNKVHFYDTNWYGGSKNEYIAVCLDNGESNELPDNFAPWNNPIEGKSVEFPENVVIVNHIYFCGKDLGIRIYANPKLSPKFLNSGK